MRAGCWSREERTVSSPSDEEEDLPAPWWTYKVDSTPLTLEILQKAMDEIWNAPVRICGVTEPHVVHPKADGITRCGMCGQLTKVRDTPDGKVKEW